jgi:hypothetical protein
MALDTEKSTSVWNAQLMENIVLETESEENIYSTELLENPGGGSGGGGRTEHSRLHAVVRLG